VFEKFRHSKITIKVNVSSPKAPNSGGTRNLALSSKSPRIGGFRGLSDRAEREGAKVKKIGKGQKG
jgi:hypothetical protein